MMTVVVVWCWRNDDGDESSDYNDDDYDDDGVGKEEYDDDDGDVSGGGAGNFQ